MSALILAAAAIALLLLVPALVAFATVLAGR